VLVRNLAAPGSQSKLTSVLTRPWPVGTAILHRSVFSVTVERDMVATVSVQGKGTTTVRRASRR
jgi:hypothetical protein